MKQKKKQTPKYREQQWLPVDRGLGIVGGAVWEIQTTGCNTGSQMCCTP